MDITYECNLNAYIDITGSKEIEIDNYYKLEFDRNYDVDELKSEILEIVKDKEFVSIYDTYYNKEITDLDGLDSFLESILDDEEVCGYIYIKFSKLKVDEEILEKLDDIDYKIINKKAVIELDYFNGEIEYSIINENYTEINIDRICELKNKIPKERLEIYLVGDGELEY